MANKLTPPPPTGTVLDRWLALLYQLLTASGQILWAQVSKAGSNLTDIETRNHADLQNLNTASYTHLTAANHTDLTDAGDSALHYHATDRARANHTGTQAATTVVLDVIGTPTYSTVQDLQNLFHSAGYISGGAVTDNGDGTIAIAAGVGAIRTSDSEVATVKLFDFSAVASQALTNGSLNWIYIDYNAGAPVVTASTSEPANHHTFVKLATVYRDGTDLHINQTVRFNVGDHASNMVQSAQETMGYAHVSGGAISETGTRNLAVTAGAFWYGLNRFTTSAIDTSVAGSFSTYHRDGAGGFTHTTGQTAVNNTQYDDGTGTLASLSANRYTNRWIYLATDSDVHVIYGQAQAVSLATIQEEQPPALIPAEIQNDSFLIGRIIVRQGTATFIQLDSAFDTKFSTSSISDHGNLTGLTDDDHTQYVLADGTRNITGPQVVTVDSASNALEIRQIGAGNALVIEDSTNPDSTPLVVDAGGALMLGVTALIAADAANPGILPRLSAHATSSNAQISLCSWINATGNAASYTLGKSRGASIGTNAAVTSGDAIGSFRFAGDDGAGFRLAATISAFVDGTVSSGIVPGRLQLQTANSAGVMTEHARLNSAGQFSVGRSAISGPALSTTVAAKFASVNATYTDSATAASGTVTHGTINSFDNPAVAASNTSVTYTNLSTVYIDGAPTAGTNVTITNPYALYVAAGAVYLGDGLSTAGNATLGDANTDAHKVNGTLELQNYTVATLPAAGTRGRTAYVTDATAPTYLGALTGGGAVVCPVFDNGTAWVSH